MTKFNIFDGCSGGDCLPIYWYVHPSVYVPCCALAPALLCGGPVAPAEGSGGTGVPVSCYMVLYSVIWNGRRMGEVIIEDHCIEVSVSFGEWIEMERGG